MFDNIAFIGGIHGVGKSTICQELCAVLRLKYLSASELLKWKEINDDVLNKKVTNIPNTQDRLIFGLNKIVEPSNNYLLDGHYCLLNSQSEIIEVPIETFRQINPISFNLIVDDINEIRRRLEERDKRPYDADLLAKMQDGEIYHAKTLAKAFGAELNIGTQKDFSKILKLP